MCSCNTVKLPIIGVNYCLPLELGNDKVFSIRPKYGSAAYECQRFKQWMESHYKVRVHTWDSIDYNSDEVRAVVYLDNTFHYFLNDKILCKIPYEKRALVLEEPSNANPFFYFVPWGRRRFKTVFTHSLRLQRKNPNYVNINVKVGGDPSHYAYDKSIEIPFASKKMLVAVSSNISSFSFFTTYGCRRRSYSFFSSEYPDDFDLYGRGWDGMGFKTYKGPIEGTFDDKIAKIAGYKFAICYENNVNEPGYISEKIFDCFCARCVPVYYGSKEIELRIPRDCFVNRRDFVSLRELGNYLSSITKERYNEYILAIEKFLRSDEIKFFSTDHYFRTMAKKFDLEER